MASSSDYNLDLEEQEDWSEFLLPITMTKTPEETKSDERLTEILQIIENARKLMLEKKTKKAREILQELWNSMKTEANFGEHHPQTLVVQFDIGRCHFISKEYQEANEIFEQIGQKMGKVLEEKDDQNFLQKYSKFTLESSSNNEYLGHIAFDVFSKLLKVQKKRIGANHLMTKQTEVAIAKVLAWSNKFKESLEIYDKILLESIKSEGHDGGRTLEIKAVVADLYEKSGKPEESLVIYKEILASQEKNGGGDQDEDLIRTRWNIQRLMSHFN